MATSQQENGTKLSVGGRFAVRLKDGTPFSVQGCPVADGQGPCSTTCGGLVTGSQCSTEDLTNAVANGAIKKPESLGCGPIVERVQAAILFIRENQAAQNEAAIPVAIPVDSADVSAG